MDEATLVEDLLGSPAAPRPSDAEVAPERLRDNRDFVAVLSGQGISALGDAVTFTALPLLVFALTGSGVAMGVVAALETLPDLIVGLPAGALADRWDRRRMMLFADLGRGLLTATIPLAALLGLPLMPVILLVVAPLNILRVIFLAAWTAATPRLVGPRLIGPASSYFEAVVNIGYFVGPAIAGLLVGLIGAPATLAIDALSFGASALSLTLVRRRLQAAGPRPEAHLVAEIREGVTFVARERTLRVALGLWAAVNIIPAALVPALTIYLERDLGLSAAVFGLVLSGYGLGSIGGALLAARLTTRVSLGGLMLAGTASQGALLVLIGLVGQPVVVVAAALLAGLAGAQTVLGYLTLRATVTPEGLLGRVGAATRVVSVGLIPLGSLVGGFVLDAISGGPTLWLMGVLLIAATIGFGLPPTLRGALVRQPSGTMAP
ncbi:MAG: MFS transporter [Candidatus Limnocylindrales bacterium]